MNTRSALIGLSLLALGACQMAPYDPGPRTAAEERRMANFIGTRHAGPASRCIPAYPGIQTEAVGDKIVAKWGGRLWVNQVQGSCRAADSSSAFLLTDRTPTNQYCENDVWKVVSNSGGMQIGSCMLGPWVPYTN